MSAISLWNYLSCRIRRSPKTAEAFRQGCAPTLPPVSFPRADSFASRTSEAITPGTSQPACAQPKALLFTLASMLLDRVSLA